MPIPWQWNICHVWWSCNREQCHAHKEATLLHGDHHLFGKCFHLPHQLQICNRDLTFKPIIFFTRWSRLILPLRCTKSFSKTTINHLLFYGVIYITNICVCSPRWPIQLKMMALLGNKKMTITSKEASPISLTNTVFWRGTVSFLKRDQLFLMLGLKDNIIDKLKTLWHI
jgi:hypothetical protein